MKQLALSLLLRLFDCLYFRFNWIMETHLTLRIRIQRSCSLLPLVLKKEDNQELLRLACSPLPHTFTCVGGDDIELIFTREF